jgi:hypothetical protein
MIDHYDACDGQQQRAHGKKDDVEGVILVASAFTCRYACRSFQGLDSLSSLSVRHSNAGYEGLYKKNRNILEKIAFAWRINIRAK